MRKNIFETSFSCKRKRCCICCVGWGLFNSYQRWGWQCYNVQTSRNFKNSIIVPLMHLLYFPDLNKSMSWRDLSMLPFNILNFAITIWNFKILGRSLVSRGVHLYLFEIFLIRYANDLYFTQSLLLFLDIGPSKDGYF